MTRASRRMEYQSSEASPQNSGCMVTNTDPLVPSERSIMDDVLGLSRRSPAREPVFSRMLLMELMKSRSTPHLDTLQHHDQNSGDKQLSFEMMADLDVSPVSLPSKEGAQALVKAYFQYANQSLPLLHEPTFYPRMDQLYAMPRMIDLAETHTTFESRMAVFFVFGVFAVALLTLQKQDPSRMPTSTADRYHMTALKALNEVGLPSNLESVQAILLVAQYSYHHPTAWAVWKTVGAALRLATELGLHRDPPDSEIDFLTLDTMRRTFWVAYAMDRNTSIALDLPLCLPDGVITAKFPTQENDEFITPEGITAHDETAPRPKRVSLHVLRYRRIQSEMQTMLHQRIPAACGIVNFDQWQKNMHERIQQWYDDTPRRESLTTRERKNLENFELTYHRALFYLYHPSPNVPFPTESALVALTTAATSMIRLYRRFFTENRLTIYWQAVENLFSAGTALMHNYLGSAAVRARISLQELESLVHTCSSVLWGMVEHFPDFKGKRDAFDMVASKTFADLSRCTDPESLNPPQPTFMSPGPSTAMPKDTLIHVENLATNVGEPENRTWQEGNRTVRPAQEASLASSRAENDMQHPSMSRQTSNGGVEAFSFTDFDDVAFDWEAFESMDDFMSYDTGP